MDSSVLTREFLDRLAQLYPMVDLKETPVPYCLEQKDKHFHVGLSQNNMRAQHKGPLPEGTSSTLREPGSVRANHPIPTACGLYYFEVKVISTGRNGYLAIGLSKHDSGTHDLPGWVKYTYGYHGDCGFSFDSSNTGRPYGPTFAAGDVVGCGLNMVDSTCFYTKNGHNLGIAAYDVKRVSELLPTVGLRTAGVVVDCNFGQLPFVFDIGDMIAELRDTVLVDIHSFAPPAADAGWQNTMHRMVQSYLVHHGYCATAEAFSNSTGIEFDEDICSIRQRQKIQKLVLAGRMGEAIQLTQRLYPGLLEKQQNLLFLLRVRQFIEMVNGTDSEVLDACDSPLPPLIEQHQPSSSSSSSTASSQGDAAVEEPDQEELDGGDASTPVSHSPSLSSSLSASVTGGAETSATYSCQQLEQLEQSHSQHASQSERRHSNHQQQQQQQQRMDDDGEVERGRERCGATVSVEVVSGGGGSGGRVTNGHTAAAAATAVVVAADNGTQQHCSVASEPSTHSSNNSSNNNNSSHHQRRLDNNNHKNSAAAVTTTSAANNNNQDEDDDDDDDDECMDVDSARGADLFSSQSYASSTRKAALKTTTVSTSSLSVIVSSKSTKEEAPAAAAAAAAAAGSGAGAGGGGSLWGGKLEKVLQFGRQLQLYYQQLQSTQPDQDYNKHLLQDAFSLLAYTDPWNSPVKWQLDPVQREAAYTALNSAILSSGNLPRRAPLEAALSHSKELVALMKRSGLGICAFVNFDPFFRQQQQQQQQQQQHQ